MALVLGVARAALAEPQAPGLNWVRLAGAGQCISAPALAALVEARVGRVLFAATPEAGLFVDGHVRGAARGWDVVLEVSDRQGRVLGRRDLHFDGDACSVIDEPVALVIAVTLYPGTGLIEGGIPLDASTTESLQALFGAEPVDPDPASLPAPESRSPAGPQPASHARPDAPAADDPSDASPAPPPARSEPWRFGFAAAATSGVGQLPGLATGATATLLVVPPSAWPIEAGVVLLPGATARAGDVAGRARFDLLVGSVAVCPWQPEWLRVLALCAGAEIGRLAVTSEGFLSGNARRSDAIANLKGALVWRAALAGALHVRAAAVVTLPLQQRAYTFETPAEPQAQLFRTPQVAARAELGLGLLF